MENGVLALADVDSNDPCESVAALQAQFLNTKAEFFDPNAMQLHTACSRFLPPDLRHIIQIALRIRRLQIDRRRNLPVLHRDNCCRHSGRSARSLRMPDLRLQR